MKQETYLTYFEDVDTNGTGYKATAFHTEWGDAFKEAHELAAHKVGRVVLVLKQVQAFSAEVVVRPVKSVPVAPVKPRKPRSDKGTKKDKGQVSNSPDLSHAQSMESDGKNEANLSGPANDPDKPLFDIPEKLRKK